MTSTGLIVSQDNGIATIALNNPPMNPLGVAQISALEALLPTLSSDPTIRVVVIRGAEGKNFSVGANLKEGDAAIEHGPKVFVAQRIALFNQIEALEKPVIAAIQGYCLGGGMELAMSCHYRIAAEGAQLGLPEVNLGAAPLWSGASRLLRLVGRSHALDLLLRGRRIGADEAYRMGLVNQLSSEQHFDGAVLELAEELAAKPPLSVASIIRVINQSQDLSLEKALEVELDDFSELAGTRDNIEGVMAMFEKRKPVFTGE